jgi:hypothetical protein
MIFKFHNNNNYSYQLEFAILIILVFILKSPLFLEAVFEKNKLALYSG